MEVTFPDRRRMVNDSKPIKEIRDPVLFCQSQIVSEFQRLLMLHTSILESFRHNIRQVSPAIIAIARTSKKFQSEMKSFLDLLDVDGVEEEAVLSLDEVDETALVLLPFLLPQKKTKVDHKEFIRFVSEDEDEESILKEGASPFPVIFVCGTLDSISRAYVVADYQVLFTVNGGIVEAVVSLFACYYVFMIEYPKSLNNVVIYMQKCLFSISDSGKIPTSVMTFTNNVGNFSSQVELAVGDEPVPDAQN